MVLLRHSNPRATKFGRKVAQLGQSVLHRQNRFGVVDVNAGHKFEIGNDRRENVGQSKSRMLGKKMAATLCAKVTVAAFRLHEMPDLFGALGHFHAVRLPERERVHRSG